jgi:hypothetical protein
MGHAKLIELRFTGGGPMDGHELFAHHRLATDDSFSTEEGRYCLSSTEPAAESESGYPVATYVWTPRANSE